MTADSLWAIRCVWMRHFRVYWRGWRYALTSTFAEPLLYILSFGFGMATLVDQVHTQGADVPYRPFVFSGIVGQAVLYQGFYETAYGSYSRIFHQKLVQAMATTPVTLSEVLWGELLWNASRGSISAFAILSIGCLCGDFQVAGALAAWPLCFLACLLFAGMGLAVSALAKNVGELSYPQFFLVFPMFLFCGLLYPIENLPPGLQPVVWLFPLTAVVSLLRTLLLGLELQFIAVVSMSSWLVLSLFLSRRWMTRRLVK